MTSQDEIRKAFELRYLKIYGSANFSRSGEYGCYAHKRERDAFALYKAALDAQAVVKDSLTVEPVAWANETAVGFLLDGYTNRAYTVSSENMDGYTVPLYTRPPAPSPAVPEGYALVPVEPNNNMKSAASKQFARKPKSTPADYYRAMLSAAPQKHTRTKIPDGVTSVRNAATGESVPSGPSAALDGKTDEIITRLYRRFKDWSNREFTADDVTWCEVKADVLELIYAAPGGEDQAQPEASNVLRFIEIAEDLEQEHPWLYVEIARTRTTDWMAWLRKKPNGDLLTTGQGSTADEACNHALSELDSGGGQP